MQVIVTLVFLVGVASMKVPPKRKGNALGVFEQVALCQASMKVPPKRKGNIPAAEPVHWSPPGLNESPSEKEGKSRAGA